MSGTSQSLFSDFSAVSDEEWQARILKDLKGKDFDATLLWNTEDGLEVPPFLRNHPAEATAGNPGQAPYRRGGKTDNNHWEIREVIADDAPEKANKASLEALNSGATCVAFTTPMAGAAVARLCKDILPEYAPVDFRTDARALEVFQAWSTLWKEKASKIRGCLGYDPLAKLASTGNWWISENDDFELLHQLVQRSKSSESPFRVLEVDTLVVHSAGANRIQELGWALAHGNAYLSYLTAKGHTAAEAANQMRFSFGTGSSYFPELAKFRAFRQLWNRVVDAYQPQPALVAPELRATTSPWNQTAYDANTNLLRATTETMSAALGGVNYITVLPYTTPVELPDGFALRIARNLQLMLKEESYLDRIVDPAAGSYYLEYLTDQLAEKAWGFFQSIEAQGGILPALQSGWLQGEIAQVAAQKKAAIASGETTLLGVNKHPNQAERLSEQLTALPTEEAAPSGAIVPLPSFRGAEALEQERFAKE
mgnify:CR=1 FL=1